MLDLIIRNATLPDGRNVDIGVRDGLIAVMEPELKGDAGQEIDAQFYLVSPPFVDSHFHLDYTLTSKLAPPNQSGTLFEGIRNWRSIKSSLTEEGIYQRARRLCEKSLTKGTFAIRSHVDIGDPEFKGVRALLNLREDMKPWMTIQLVAFPQDGFFRKPDAEKLLKQALDMGLDVVGGIPHYERSRSEGDRSIHELFRLAANHGLLVDMHCDENDDPESRHIETMAACSVEFSLQGRVTGSHLTSMHSMDNAYADKLISLMAESGVAAIANPLVNMTLQGRFDTYPRRRGMTRIPELLAAGIPVGLGHDCVMDPWYGLGSHDMLEVASMAVHGAHMTGADQISDCFAGITTLPARIMHLDNYGLEVGKDADLIILQARSIMDAIRLRSERLYVLRKGLVISTSSPSVSTLYLGDEKTIDAASGW
jgi:cytosine deaminase